VRFLKIKSPKSPFIKGGKKGSLVKGAVT